MSTATQGNHSDIGPESHKPSVTQKSGLDGFIDGISQWARQTADGGHSTIWFILRIAGQYAYIHLQDAWHPLRFLRQMASVPPIQFGTKGFRKSLVDDANPARHYTAFVFVGFWLPYILAVATLWMWEIAGFIRYRGVWSQNDVRCGYVGIHHGRLVRRFGPLALPGLIARDLAEPEEAV